MCQAMKSGFARIVIVSSGIMVPPYKMQPKWILTLFEIFNATEEIFIGYIVNI